MLDVYVVTTPVSLLVNRMHLSLLENGEFVDIENGEPIVGVNGVAAMVLDIPQNTLDSIELMRTVKGVIYA